MKNFIVWGGLVVAALLIVYPLAFGGDSLLKSNNASPVKPEKSSEATNITGQTSLLSESAISSTMQPQYGTGMSSYKNEDNKYEGEPFNDVESGIDSKQESQHIGSAHVSPMDPPLTDLPEHLGDVNINIDHDSGQ